MTERGRDDEPGREAALALCILAVDPASLGGLHLRARSGPLRDALMAQLKITCADRPVRRLPLTIPDSRLLGGLDLGATLTSGRPVSERGLLADCDGGIVVAPTAERMSGSLAARLAAVLDTHEVAVEREGFAKRDPGRIAVIALDEGLEPDERPPSILLERLALQVLLPDRATLDAPFAPYRIAAARNALHNVTAGDDMLRALCESALMLGVQSGRAPAMALQVARIHAALCGRSCVMADDASVAARLVYGFRATVVPVEEQQDDSEDTPPPPEQGDDGEAQQKTEQDLTDVVLAAAKASIPKGLLDRIRTGQAPAMRRAATGTAGNKMRAKRGRPLGSRQGELTAGARLNVVDTLRAAAPWQALRRRQLGGVESDVRRIAVRREDFRFTHYTHHSETVTVFVVDASGSSAVHRLAEAKGAVELLLADCYVRRDQVALIAFRGQSAELLLPPTRSLPRAKRSLAALPGGGGTPLAAALDAARDLADQARRKGQTPVVVLMTDGRANIARDGTQGRENAEADAGLAARAIRTLGLTCLMVDTSPSPHAAARRLADSMGAQYLPLPRADALTLSNAVRAAL